MDVGAESLFWARVAALGQVAGALATTAAVIVSLWVVLSERTARVRTTAGLRLLITPGVPEATEEVVNITVTNIGLRTVRVSTIGWRVGWLGRFGPKWARYAYAVQTPGGRRDSHDPPFVLEPGEQKSLLVDLAAFTGNEEKAQRSIELYSRSVPVIGRVAANIRCAAHIVGARSTYFAVEKPLAELISSGAPGRGVERVMKAAAKQAARSSSGLAD